MIITTKAELRDACRTWSGDEGTFREILTKYFSLWGAYQRDLAHRLGMAESTVARWMSGASRPHPAYQPIVIARIVADTRERTAIVTRSGKAAPQPKKGSAKGARGRQSSIVKVSVKVRKAKAARGRSKRSVAA